MSLKIAICDDNGQDRAAVSGALRAFVDGENIPCSITTFDTPHKLLAYGCFDLYFLDIMMPLMDGMALAEKLRKNQPECGIVFITSSSDYAVRGYSVNAAGYLLKPLRAEQAGATFRRLFDSFAPQTMKVTIDGAPVDVPVRSILFMESQLRSTVIYLKNGDSVLLHKRLEDVWTAAENHSAFVRCHKSFIVNLDHVLQMEASSFQMVNGTEVPISRNARANSKAAYYKRKVQTGG